MSRKIKNKNHNQVFVQSNDAKKENLFIFNVHLNRYWGDRVDARNEVTSER